VIVVTFGGGVRYEDTMASGGMGQHPAPGIGARAAGTRVSGRAP
jgi:hypothetical protein